MTLSGRDIVCVGFSDWDTRVRTTQHHLAVRIARQNRLLFVESLGLRRPQIAGSDVRRMARRASRVLSPLREVDGLHVLSPFVLPLHGSRLARGINAKLLPLAVTRAARALGLSEPLLWSFVPQAEALIEPLKPSQILYYVTDDHAAKPGIDGASFRASEERFARRADVVLASAPELVARMRELNDNVHYAPAVTDVALFSSTLDAGPVDDAVARLEEPRIVFIGAILAATIDLELLVRAAELRPHWSFVLVGPVGQGDPHTDIEPLRRSPNVHLLGARRPDQLPQVLRGADCAMIPYRTGHQMRSVFPMKTYEYLAAGRPVVSTPLETLVGVADVELASTVEQFVALAERAIEHDNPQARLERSDRARGHSWEARIEQMATVLAGARRRR